jgi:hypothetical protein
MSQDLETLEQFSQHSSRHGYHYLQLFWCLS